MTKLTSAFQNFRNATKNWYRANNSTF